MPESRVIARAPGRVNLIGEHTDYNDGYVLPMALPFETTFRAVARPDRVIVLRSVGYGEAVFGVDADPAGIDLWARYVAGMVRFLIEDGIDVSGFEADISTTIPVGASLSSSAALEVAAGFAVAKLSGREPDPVRVAQLGRRVENEIIGVPAGIMDQLISAIAVEGSASRIDCRDLAVENAELPTGTRVLIMDTMTRRELVDSEYGDRRRSCERAAAALGLDSLRDAVLGKLDLIGDPVDRRRAMHVVTENDRVLAAVEAMRSDDPVQLGALMNASHESLRSDYEVSSDALDAISDHARRHGACFGARMTGGGFAGCAVALVSDPGSPEVIDHVRSEFRRSHGTTPDIWAVRPAAGASVEAVGQAA